MDNNIFIHDTAEVSEHAVIGEGTKIWNHAQVRENCTIGANTNISKNCYVDFGVTIGSKVKLQNNVSIFNGVTIEDEVFLGPYVAFTNDFRPRATSADWQVTPTLVEKGASLGANCTIVCGTTIGRYAMVAAGAVVTRSVPAHVLVAGNPAKPIAYVYKDGNKVLAEHACNCEGDFVVYCNPKTDERLKLLKNQVKVIPSI